MSTTRDDKGGFGGLLRDMRAALGEMITGGKLEPGQELTVEVLFGLLGALARADSIVTTHEAEFVNALMDELDLPNRGRELAMAAFDAGRQKQLDTAQLVNRFLAVHAKHSAEVDRLYDALLRLAGADGRVRPREREFLDQITRDLGYAPGTLQARLDAMAAKAG